MQRRKSSWTRCNSELDLSRKHPRVRNPKQSYRQCLPKWSQAFPKANSGLLIPSVRHILKEMNLNIADIQGTGKNGRIMKEDVHRHNLGNLTLHPVMSNATEPVFPPAGAKDRLVFLTATQNALFKTMSRSLTIPHFLYTQSVDLIIPYASSSMPTQHSKLSNRLNSGLSPSS